LSRWPKNPRVYEINTAAWLSGLGSRYQRAVDLSSVPAQEWNAVAELGMDAVWLMGVWQRSPLSRKRALEAKGVLPEMERALSDLVPEDVIGSAYSVRRYEVDERFGGQAGLSTARKELAKRGVMLVLDFVPNHTAVDHPWVVSHPEFYVRGSPQDLVETPGLFTELDGGVFAYGKDPYFPAWTDVLQLNAFSGAVRKETVEILRGIAGLCDGIRCDMAMLVMNDVFERTWGEHAGHAPDRDFWEEVIPSVKEIFPDVLFMAEAYWDLEWALMEQGFDCCYDKRLYDRLLCGNAHSVRLHLGADPAYQERLVRFLENHDERRCAEAFPPGRLEAAAVAVTTLPGVRLFHEGQFEGRRVRLPVQLARGPLEPLDGRLKGFYSRLLKVTRTPVMREGRWELCGITGWPDNPTCASLLAWDWVLGPQRRLVVINFSDRPAQGLVKPNGLESGPGELELADLMGGGEFRVKLRDAAGEGIYVDLGPWGYHVMSVLNA